MPECPCCVGLDEAPDWDALCDHCLAAWITGAEHKCERTQEPAEWEPDTP